MPSYNLVVYGGNPWAVSAAVAAKKVAPSMTVALVVDYPNLTENDAHACRFSSDRRLGGIYSVGGEIKWDDYGVAGGTYRFEMFERTGRRYLPDQLADLLDQLLSEFEIEAFYGYHVSNVFASPNGGGHPEVSRVDFRPITYDPAHRYTWDPDPVVTLSADFFVDASVDARLIRAVAPDTLTVGRYDWPADRLTPGEARGGIVQSSSICVRLGNFETRGASSGEWRHEVLDKNGAIHAYNLDLFNRTSGRLFCGPGDWDAEDDSTIWATGSHVFNVDPRAFDKDRGTDLFPNDLPHDALTYDEGYALLRSEIESGRWIEALSEGLGMPDLEFLAVAPVMYVREGSHAVLDASRKGHGTENTNYAIRATDAILAGYAGSAGDDGRFHWQRVGVAHYGLDLHAYTFSDLYDPNNDAFFWRPEVEERIRPDLDAVRAGWWNPPYGVWLPFEMIVAPDIANLLLCGYNVGASSLAWGELREAPNLCVLGDACGAAAATLFTHGDLGSDFAELTGHASFVSLVQEALIDGVGANLDSKRRKYRDREEAA